MNIVDELRAQANQDPLDADLTMFDVAASKIEEQQAHIARLRETLLNLEEAAEYAADAHGLGVYADLCEQAGAACRVLDETPSQSLEALNYRVMRKPSYGQGG